MLGCYLASSHRTCIFHCNNNPQPTCVETDSGNYVTTTNCSMYSYNCKNPENSKYTPMQLH